jgi:hypothetical protein
MFKSTILLNKTMFLLTISLKDFLFIRNNLFCFPIVFSIKIYFFKLNLFLCLFHIAHRFLNYQVRSKFLKTSKQYLSNGREFDNLAEEHSQRTVSDKVIGLSPYRE